MGGKEQLEMCAFILLGQLPPFRRKDLHAKIQCSPLVFISLFYWPLNYA